MWLDNGHLDSLKENNGAETKTSSRALNAKQASQKSGLIEVLKQWLMGHHKSISGLRKGQRRAFESRV